jgi:hypothetical protein
MGRVTPVAQVKNCTDTGQWIYDISSSEPTAVEKLTRNGARTALYPNRRSSKYFATINCILTTTHESLLVYLHTTVAMTSTHSWWSFHITFCVQTKHVSRYQQTWALESSGAFSWTDRLTAQRHHDVLSGLLEDIPLPLAMRQRLWFQHDAASAHYEEHGRQWLNATYTGRWTGRRGPITWSSRSLHLSSMIPPTRGAGLCSFSQDYRKSHSNTAITFDANTQAMFRRMSCGELSSALKWTEAASSTYCKYEASVIFLWRASW